MPIPITFLITDLHRGGTPLLLSSLARGLAARNIFSPEVISIAPLGEVAAELSAAGIPVTSLNARGPKDLTPALHHLLAHLRHRPPHLLCSMLIHANLLFALAKPFLPRIPWVQSLHTVQHNPRWHWYLQGILSNYADAFVAPSHAILQKLQAYGPIPQPTVIPNGIDFPRFETATPITDVPWLTTDYVVGYVGRFDAVKRLPLLLHALALLPDPTIKLALVGYGPQEPQLQALTDQLGLRSRVHFIGPSATPERWYKAFSLFCSPSDAEGFGLTLIEAFAAGTLVLTCATAATREVLAEAPVAWLSPDPSPQEIANQVKKAKNRASESLKIANELKKSPENPQKSQEIAENYGLDRMVAAYETLFSTLL